ncbi:MAG: tetratricopeptide repeat protein, partial [Deltaproteobacteria bacterium]|nr:tetratricopeptide repeat protein [Deltaproteobacteria bacterium]
MRRLLLVLCVVGVALACGISADAHAQQQGTSTDEEARARFEAGRAHYDAGRFREALTEFRAAYELSPRPLLLYNIYLASLDLGEIHDAADALRRYLATDEVDPNERTQLQARLRALDERIAREG